MKLQLDESGWRVHLGDNRRWNSHATTNQVPVCWSLDFSWTLLYKYIYGWLFVQSTRTCAKFDLRRIPRAWLLRKSGSAYTLFIKGRYTL